MTHKSLKQNLSIVAGKEKAAQKTIIPPKKPSKRRSGATTNGIVESEKNRPEADAASPSIFDKSFEADPKK